MILKHICFINILYDLLPQLSFHTPTTSASDNTLKNHIFPSIKEFLKLKSNLLTKLSSKFLSKLLSKLFNTEGYGLAV